ncbi:MAG: glycosyltransferase family 87 protein [Gammaproteobacteria bacterium]|jgi:hypothetical protein
MPNTINKKQIYLLIATLIIWLIPLALGCIYTAHHHFLQGVSRIYYAAAWRWIHHQSLYDFQNLGWGFVYAPSSAILYIPIAILPLKISEITWRILSIGLLVLGVYKLSKLENAAQQFKCFFIVTLVSAWTMLTVVRDGQMHLILTGIIMLGLAAIANKYFWQAAILITLSIALKPTAIVMYLLVLILYPQVRYKLLFASLILILLLLFTQNFSYVIQQHHAFLYSLKASIKGGVTSTQWAQLFGAIHFYAGYLIPTNIQRAIRIIFAIITLLICYAAKKKMSTKQTVWYIYAIGITYLMLFNVRTENNNYIMLAPAIGFMLHNFLTQKKYLLSLLCVIMTLLLWFNHPLAAWITPHNNIWLKPTAALAFYLILLWRVITTPASLASATNSRQTA